MSGIHSFPPILYLPHCFHFPVYIYLHSYIVVHTYIFWMATKVMPITYVHKIPPFAKIHLWISIRMLPKSFERFTLQNSTICRFKAKETSNKLYEWNIWANPLALLWPKVIIEKSRGGRFLWKKFEIWAGFGSFGNTEKNGTIMSNFWGRFFHVFRGKKG